MIRLLSHFSVKDGDGELRRIPVTYGDASRLAAYALKDGSEATLGAVPKIAIYITALEIDRERTSDSSFVSKVHIRERAFDENNQEYLNTEGRNYTVERLMPTPYQLSMNADIWTTNTDQKLQILEQILMLFNPSLEIQTTDNFIDWTSLTVVDLMSVNFSSRSVGSASTETEIDIASLGFKTPIFISPPVKVKRLGVIHTIITSIFNEQHTAVQNHDTMPEHLAWASDHPYKSDTQAKPTVDENGNVSYEIDIPMASRSEPNSVSWATTYKNYDLIVLNNEARLVNTDQDGSMYWEDYILAHAKPNCFHDDITALHLWRNDYDTEIIGTVARTDDPFVMSVTFDQDTLPGDTVLTGPTGDKNKINYILNPIKTDPNPLKTPGIRIMLLESGIGADHNVDGADAWKNNDGSDFVAAENDIVEWDGNRWWIVFSTETFTNDEPVYTTNLNTGVQYKYTGTEWLLSYEGRYPHGTWQLNY